MSKRELLVALAIAAVFVCTITGIKIAAIDRQRGDTALFFQIPENIAQRGQPVSQVFANTQAFLESGLLSKPPEQVSADPLDPPALHERNMMGFHAYAILYLTGLLARILPSDLVVYGQMVLSFIGLALLSYVFLRQAQVSVIAALAFCLLVVSHPAWSQSLLAGQPYPDRLFLLAGFAFMYLATRQTTSRTVLIALGILCASINERAAIVAGEFLVLHSIFFRHEHVRERTFRLALGAALFSFGLIITKLVLHNPEYGSFLPQTPHQFALALTAPGIPLFVLVNLPFLILAFFEPRMALIAIVTMLPNIFGSIGGGEKTGWITSYHSYYQPVLMLAALLGYERFLERMAAWGHRFLAVPALAALIAFLCLLSPNDVKPIRFGTAYASEHFFPKLIENHNRYFGADAPAFASAAERLRAAIPKHATISTVEAGMPLVYQHDEVRFFPIDIDHADYALMSYGKMPSHTWYFGAISFLGPEQQTQLDTLILRRMRADGYDFEHAQTFPPLGLTLVKRTLSQRVGSTRGA